MARCPHGWKIRRVKTEEIDAGLAVMSHVGANIEFRKNATIREVAVGRARECRSCGRARLRATMRRRRCRASAARAQEGGLRQVEAASERRASRARFVSSPMDQRAGATGDGSLTGAVGARHELSAPEDGSEFVIADSQARRVPCEHSYVPDCNQCSDDAETLR